MYLYNKTSPLITLPVYVEAGLGLYQFSRLSMLKLVSGDIDFLRTSILSVDTTASGCFKYSLYQGPLLLTEIN